MNNITEVRKLHAYVWKCVIIFHSLLLTVDPCCRVHEKKKKTDKSWKKRHPKFKFSSHTKGCLGCWFPQCTLQGAHISQLTIQLNNECEGRIGSTLAKSLFFSSGKCAWGEGEGAGGCVGPPLSRFISRWHQRACCSSLPVQHMAPGFEQRADVQCQTAAINAETGRRKDLASLLNIKRFQPIFLSVHLDVSLFGKFDLLTFFSPHLWACNVQSHTDQCIFHSCDRKRVPQMVFLRHKGALWDRLLAKGRKKYNTGVV